MEMIYAIGEFLPMRRVKYDHEEVPFSVDKYPIHGWNIPSMDLEHPWVPCNICFIGGGSSASGFKVAGGVVRGVAGEG